MRVEKEVKGVYDKIENHVLGIRSVRYIDISCPGEKFSNKYISDFFN
ncbi:MAG: hypothetical protein K0B07_01265 [DPANN group archaeon]|nr:hypothetical protein [DPANN group archaeon]